MSGDGRDAGVLSDHLCEWKCLWGPPRFRVYRFWFSYWYHLYIPLLIGSLIDSKYSAIGFVGNNALRCQTCSLKIVVIRLRTFASMERVLSMALGFLFVKCNHTFTPYCKRMRVTTLREYVIKQKHQWYRQAESLSQQTIDSKLMDYWKPSSPCPRP